MVYPFHYRHWILLTLFALVVRGGAQFAAWHSIGPLPGLESDPDSYRILAETLQKTGTMGVPIPGGGVDPTAFRPPMYPYLLSWMVTNGRLPSLAVAIFHLILGTLTCLLTCDLVRRWIAAINLRKGKMSLETGHLRTRLAPCLALFLVAIDPLLLTQSTLVMTETLAAFMAVLVAWLLLGNGKLHWLVISTILALGFLTRPVFVIWTVLILAWQIACVLWDAPRRKQALVAVVSVLLIPAFVITLWTQRNIQRLGAPVWATTHGGYTLLLGNNPYYYQFLQSHSFWDVCLWGDAWNADPFHHEWRARIQSLQEEWSLATVASPAPSQDRELAQDRAAQSWASQTIDAAPHTFLYACCIRVIHLWSPMPRLGSHITVVSYLLGIYYCLIYASVARAKLRLRWQLLNNAGVASFLLAIALTAVHAVYWSNIRMRAPIMPLLLAVAAIGSSVIVTRSDD